MIKPYYQDEFATIYHGDCREILKQLADGSVNCCVTSPPYFALRDYGVDGQIGLEQTPSDYVAEMVKVFREVKRVLRDDGTLWLNIGDSYANNGNLQPHSGQRKNRDQTAMGFNRSNIRFEGMKQKDLVGIPWMLAFALRADGWYLRQDIIWSKPNPMPESVTDRCTKSHEYIFLLSKSQRYYYNAKAIAEKTVTRDTSHRQRDITKLNNTPGRTRMAGLVTNDYELRNKRSVWTVTTSPYSGAHFAIFPAELISPCILAGCPEGGTVLDPFAGSGTTLQVARWFACKSVGIELNEEYCKLQLKRLAQSVFDFS